MIKRRKIVLAIIAIAIIIGLAGWIVIDLKHQQEKAVKTSPIKIGVLADLSGDYVDYLKGIPSGVELAVADLQQITSRKIELFVEDQKSCDVKETVSVMHKFIDIDQVDFIIGGSCSNTTIAAAPLANQAKIVMISPASSAPSITNAGDYIFRTYISDVLRAKVGAQIAYDMGKRKMATITDIGNDAGIELTKGGRDEFGKLGGMIVDEESVTKADNDFKTLIVKIKNTQPDVIFMGVSPPLQIGLIAKQLKELDFHIQLISPFEESEDAQVKQVAKDAIEGLIYIVPGNPPEASAYQDLIKKYQEKYNEDKMPLYLTEAYDAAQLGVRAILASNGTKEDIKDKLYEVSKEYQGVSGNVMFDENGDVNKDVLVKMIKDGQYIEYKK